MLVNLQDRLVLQEKECWKCKDTKPFSDFCGNKSRPDGKHDMCKPCSSEDSKRRYRENVAKYLWASAKARADKRGLDFDIDIEDVVVPKVCPLLNIPLYVGKRNESRKNSPSLDRIDNNYGYIKGNIQVISNKANTVKNDLSFEEFEMMYENWRDTLS